MDKAQTILIVDPETDFLEWAQRQLETTSTRVVTATAADEAFKRYCRDEPDLLITETHLSPFSGLELLVKKDALDVHGGFDRMWECTRQRAVVRKARLSHLPASSNHATSRPFTVFPLLENSHLSFY